MNEEVCQMSDEKNIISDFVDVLACPKCRSGLNTNEVFKCTSCGNVYLNDHGILNFIFREFSDDLKEELEIYEPHPNELFDSSKTKGHWQAYHLVRRKLPLVLKKLKASSESKVLCIAVGEGQEIPYIKPITEHIVGIDISLDALKECVSKNNILGLLAEAQLLPFKDNSFDFVVVSAFVHHFAFLPGDDVHFTEFRRVLKKSGWIITLEPNLFYPFNAIFFPIRMILEKLRPGSLGGVVHEKAVTPFYIKRSLAKNGFGEIEWEAATFCHNRFPLLLGKLVGNSIDRLGKTILRWFSWWIIMYAKKT